jgi:hypothetical protein
MGKIPKIETVGDYVELLQSCGDSEEETGLGRIFFTGSFKAGDEAVPRVYSIVDARTNKKGNGLLKVRYDDNMDTEVVRYSKHKGDRRTPVIIQSFPLRTVSEDFAGRSR